MSTIVIGTLPTGEFALEQTFDTVPEMNVECERILGCGDSASLPFLWITSPLQTEVCNALSADPSTETVVQIVDFGNTGLYYVQWTPEVEAILELLLGSDGVILQAGCSSSVWKLRLFYPDHEAVSTLDVNCTEQDVDFTITRLQGVDADQTFWYGLTTKQYDTLQMAWERGYFSVPRQIDIQELSTEMDISHQALSERLRRGQYALIDSLFGSVQ